MRAWCLRIAEHGEHHLLSAPAYFEYARALLRKAQSENDLMGGALSKEKQAQAEGGPSDAQPAGDDDDDDDDEEGEGGAEGEGEGDDLELAFQCFEVARLIYEKARARRPRTLPRAAKPRPCSHTLAAPRCAPGIGRAPSTDRHRALPRRRRRAPSCVCARSLGWAGRGRRA